MIGAILMFVGAFALALVGILVLVVCVNFLLGLAEGRRFDAVFGSFARFLDAAYNCGRRIGGGRR